MTICDTRITSCTMWNALTSCDTTITSIIHHTRIYVTSCNIICCEFFPKKNRLRFSCTGRTKVLQLRTWFFVMGCCTYSNRHGTARQDIWVRRQSAAVDPRFGERQENTLLSPTEKKKGTPVLYFYKVQSRSAVQ